jgi:PBP1b-binding outer membrane lipoprotein LpoB
MTLARIGPPIFLILALVACTGPEMAGQPPASPQPATQKPVTPRQDLEACAREPVDQLAAQFDEVVGKFDAKSGHR